MFHGTTIDELFDIVERAEEHSHPTEMKSEDNSGVMYPGFLANFTAPTRDWVGAF